MLRQTRPERRIALTLGLLLAWLTLSASAVDPNWRPGVGARQGPPMASAPDREQFAALDSYLVDARAQLGIAGLAAVVVKGDRIAHIATAGVADPNGRPITGQTPFTLGSTSKAFTALAVMQLVEMGLLDLDAPVTRYLPWFTPQRSDPTRASPVPATTSSGESPAEITVRQLLFHASGISRRAEDLRLDGTQDAGALERIVRVVAAMPLASRPGGDHHYASSNYDVLGLIVQAVSGQGFSEYLKEHVFEPLEMPHSHATLAAARADGLATGFYHWFGVMWQPAEIELSAGAAACCALYVSPEDLGHELIAHLNGGRYGGREVLSAAGIATLHAPGVKIDDAHAYAMGWVLRPLWERLDPTVPSGGAFSLPVLIEHGGSAPTGHTYVGMVPSESWGVALLANSNDEADEAPFLTVDQNVLRTLTAQSLLPMAGAPDPLVRYGRTLLLPILLVQLVSLAWSARRLLRANHTHALQTKSAVVGFILALGLDLAVVWLVLSWAPRQYGQPASSIAAAAPDFAIAAIPALVLAVAWGPLRSALFLWGIRGVVTRRRP
jgi:CubicO group peptidase (beta-lactamase class C family)